MTQTANNNKLATAASSSREAIMATYFPHSSALSAVVSDSNPSFEGVAMGVDCKVVVNSSTFADTQVSVDFVAKDGSGIVVSMQVRKSQLGSFLNSYRVA